MKEWSGQAFTSVSYKIDGVNARLNAYGEVVSRRGKPLYNIPTDFLVAEATYEIYTGNFDRTSSIVRSKNGHSTILTLDHIYQLTPVIDSRLIAPIETSLDDALALGYEGLVFDGMYKLKPKPTFDVEVLGTIPGTGKHLGRLGALITSRGKVGTGFTDKEREQCWPLGTLIEVECLGLTSKGYFRHPRFLRIRWDK